MSFFSVYMLALAGIEIVVGLTIIGTLLAIILFNIGDSKENKPTEERVDSVDEDKDTEKAESRIVQKVEKPGEDEPKVPEKETDKPVMAILQKPESNDKPAEGEELERQIVEKRLQRIADKKAKQKEDEPDELPAMPSPPIMTGNKSDLPPIPKPFLHELPQPGGVKPTKARAKKGGNMSPMPGSASEQDDPNLQTRDKKRES